MFLKDLFQAIEYLIKLCCHTFANIHFMAEDILTVREIAEKDIELITNYWLSSSPDFLRAMGADPGKIPAKEKWRETTSLSNSRNGTKEEIVYNSSVNNNLTFFC